MRTSPSPPSQLLLQLKWTELAGVPVLPQLQELIGDDVVSHNEGRRGAGVEREARMTWKQHLLTPETKTKGVSVSRL